MGSYENVSRVSDKIVQKLFGSAKRKRGVLKNTISWRIFNYG